MFDELEAHARLAAGAEEHRILVEAGRGVAQAHAGDVQEREVGVPAEGGGGVDGELAARAAGVAAAGGPAELVGPGGDGGPPSGAVPFSASGGGLSPSGLGESPSFVPSGLWR